MPSNVLMGDSSSDWMKVGVPLVLQQDLMYAPYTSPSLAKDESSATQLGAQQILRTSVESRQNRVHLEVTIVDAATQKISSTSRVDAESMSTLIPALNSLAKTIDEKAGEFSTRNTDVLETFALAAQEQNAQTRMEMLNKAVATDPAFGLGYFLVLETLPSGGEEIYKPLLDKARAHSAAFTPYDRARLDLIASQLAHSPLDQRLAAAQALLNVAPNDMEVLAIAGGMAFLKGDEAGGVAALNHALEISPNNPNLQAQLAQGYIQTRHFGEAEKLLAAMQSNPAVLPELATCILLGGDASRANQTAERFFASVPNADYQTMLRASWLELSGQRAKAINMVESASFATPNIRAAALSEAAVWRMLDKDFSGARKTATQAAEADNHPTAISAVAALLVDGSEPPDEWRQKVAASELSDQQKEPVLAYGFFLNGRYAEAAQEWRKLLDKTDDSDLRARTMLASSLDRAGKTEEAAKIRVQPFAIPEFADIYGSVSFAEMQRLTGLVR